MSADAMSQLLEDWVTEGTALFKSLQALQEENDRLKKALHEMSEQKDSAYSERNKCVALIARMALDMGLRAGVGPHLDSLEDWEDGWRTVLFIDLPNGQVSWHFHDSEAPLLRGIPAYSGVWDGHSRDEKYRRVALGFLSSKLVSR